MIRSIEVEVVSDDVLSSTGVKNSCAIIDLSAVAAVGEWRVSEMSEHGESLAQFFFQLGGDIRTNLPYSKAKDIMRNRGPEDPTTGSSHLDLRDYSSSFEKEKEDE